MVPLASQGGKEMDGPIARPTADGFETPTSSAGALLDAAVLRFGQRPAMDFMGRRWTYAQLGSLANRAAAGLQKLGVAKGVNVGLCLPNCPYFVIMYYAILKTGATVVNFNPLYTAHEIEAQARDANVAMMVSLDLALIQDKIGKLAAKGIFKRVIICRMADALPAGKGAALSPAQGQGTGRDSENRALYRVPPADRGALRRLRPSTSTRKRTLRSCNSPAGPPARRKRRC